MTDRLLTTSEAATFLGTSPRTLEDWRLRGGGPVYLKVGRRLVRYRPADLDRFVEDGARINTGGRNARINRTVNILQVVQR